MAIKKSELYSTLAKCTNKLRSNCGLDAELFKNYVLIMLFLKYISDRDKSGELELLQIPEGCHFEDIVALKDTNDVGDKINKIIGKIKDSNEGVLNFINVHEHDFCDKRLGTTKEASAIITGLISAFQSEGLDFTKNRAADDDLIGDAYEYLMRNFASQSGKDKGQFFTPTEVSRLMALLLGIDKDERKNVSIYDPTCGSGSLLLRIRAAAKKGMQVSLQGQELVHGNVEMCNLNMIIHGDELADIRQGDTLNAPKHIQGNRLNQFDYIVSNPPFSLHNWMSTAKEDDAYGRWNVEMGVPPQQYGDFAFLMHVVKSLRYDGKAAIILPNGVLTRGGDEKKLRAWLVERKLISGIVALPPNTFYGTGIAGNIIIVDKKGTEDGIFFIDASKGYYKDEDSKNRLREQDIRRIADVWDARRDVPGYARLVSFDKIDDYNLNIPRYVESVDLNPEHNIEAHLHGGIPMEDVDNMKDIWNICPNLKTDLFSETRPGFYKPNYSDNSLNEAIIHNDDYQKQMRVFEKAYLTWEDGVRTLMENVDIDCHPKDEIENWSGLMIFDLSGKRTLLNPYDAYDQLMNYWAASMQDDLYMVSRDGWGKHELVLPKKKTFKWSELVCDLLPVNIVVEKFLLDQKDEYEKTAETIDQLTEKLNEKTENEDGEEILVISDEKIRKDKEKELKKLKASLKDQNLKLVKEITETYHNFSAEDVCKLVVNDKWLADIRKLMQGEMNKGTNSLFERIKTLNDRYSTTLSDIEKEVTESENAVLNHLKAMGFEL